MLPLLAHMLELIPDDWRVVVLGSDDTIRLANERWRDPYREYLPILGLDGSSFADDVHLTARSGSSQQNTQVQSSSIPPALFYQATSRLQLRTLSDYWTDHWGRKWDDELSIEEVHNRLLTNASFYELELAETEHLFVWHSDAILCAGAEKDLDDWTGWDWVGAPWYV